MKKIWIGSLLLLNSCFALDASAIPTFENLSQTKDAVFLLSTPKSGTNVMSGSLSIITRKPISWIYWGYAIFDSSSKHRTHPSYNRLNLSLVTDVPLLYRTHYEYAQLKQIPSTQNKLIFLSRNPKELLFRRFFLTFPKEQNPDSTFIADFLNEYLEPFYVFDQWFSENKRLVFYEDFIVQQDDILLDLLRFISENPLFYEDYINHKQEYMTQLLNDYKKQHTHNSGGISSTHGPNPMYYSKNALPETLIYIDEYLKSTAPQLWALYLKRFEYK